MKLPHVDIDRAMQDEAGIHNALREARLAALRRHFHADVPVVVWQDGRVVEVSADTLLRQPELPGRDRKHAA